MRLAAYEKLEIIGLVEQSHLCARRTLQMLGIKPSTFLSGSDLVGRRPSKTSRRSRIGFGTAFPTTSGSALS
jgi:hypothetical protein